MSILMLIQTACAHSPRGKFTYLLGQQQTANQQLGNELRTLWAKQCVRALRTIVLINFSLPLILLALLSHSDVTDHMKLYPLNYSSSSSSHVVSVLLPQIHSEAQSDGASAASCCGEIDVGGIVDVT